MRRHIIILLSTACSVSANAAPAAPFWTISEASGGALVMHQGVVRAARRNDRLAIGDAVMTGANARAVLVRGEEYAVVAPSSRLVVADPAQTGGLVQMIERFGNVVFSIKKMATPHFGVQTPYLAAVVKGTTFSVTVSDSDAAVQVVEGAVEVATNDGRERDLVRPGGVAHVSSNDLGHLVLHGDTTPVSQRSSARPTVGGAQAPAAATPSAAEQTKSGGSSPSLAADLPRDADVAIPAMEEAPQSIAGLSGGLISGDTAMRLAVVASGTSSSDRQVQIASGRIVPSVPTNTAPTPTTPVSPSPGGSASPTATAPATEPTPPLASTPVVTSPTATAPVAAPPSAPTAATPVVTDPVPGTPASNPTAAAPTGLSIPATAPAIDPSSAPTPSAPAPAVNTPSETAPAAPPPVLPAPANPPTRPAAPTPPAVVPTPPVTPAPVATPIVTSPVATPPVVPSETTGSGVLVSVGTGGVSVTPSPGGTGAAVGGVGFIGSNGKSDDGPRGGRGGTDNGKGNGGMNNGLQVGKFGK